MKYNITEKKLKKIVAESLKKVIKENANNDFTLTSELGKILEMLQEAYEGLEPIEMEDEYCDSISYIENSIDYIKTLIKWCTENNVDHILSSEDEAYDDYFLRNNPSYYPD